MNAEQVRDTNDQIHSASTATFNAAVALVTPNLLLVIVRYHTAAH